MPNLIKELTKEHSFLLYTLHKAKYLVVTSEEGQSTLHDAKNAFVAHLKKEDELLYPVLRKAAETSEELKLTLDKFFKDMDEVSETTVKFFNKYDKGGEGIEFAKDFGRLFITLSRRIKKEESIIYEKYSELMQL